jgi:hypothetical protein
MIIAIGVDVDDTFAQFVHHALEAGATLRCINLRVAVSGAWRFDLPPTGPAKIENAGEVLTLAPDDAYFWRPINLSVAETDPIVRRRWHALLSGLRAWLNAVPGCVVNRPSGGEHNGSKPMHEALLRDLGLRVPDSVTSSDPDVLRAFVCEGPTISKTVCGVRADAVVVTEDAFAGFDPASGPVHLQRLVKGDDARVHVIGEHLVAQVAPADAVDYRRAGAIARMEVIEPPTALRDLLVAATSRIGLAFAAWDFKIDPDGTYWCLEANPMPGYGPYDLRCDGAISRALRRYLDEDSP